MLAVDDIVALYIFHRVEPLLLQFREFRLFAHRLKNGDMASLCGTVFGIEIMEEVAKTQTVAADLVGVCRADAFTGSSNLGTAFRTFIGRVEQTVCRHNQMHLLRYFQHFLKVDA